MAKHGKNIGEQVAEFGRNFNTVIALGSAAVALAIPGPNVIIASYATFNAVQAGGWEVLRQWSRKKKKNSKP